MLPGKEQKYRSVEGLTWYDDGNMQPEVEKKLKILLNFTIWLVM